MLKKRLTSFVMMCLCLCLMVVPAFAASSPFLDFNYGDDGVNISVGGEGIGSGDSAYENLFTNYKAIAQVITGICIITSLICFLYQITRLGAAGDNDRARKSAITGILVSGLVLTAFGGLEIVVSVFWNAL